MGSLNMKDFRQFVFDCAGDPQTIEETFIMRRLGTIYSPGLRIRGEYEVRESYEGGMGVVVAVYNLRHQRMYALKTLREELLLSRRAREGFENECRFWVSLDNPYIVPAYFTPVMSGRFFVAMEYIEPDADGRVTLLDHIQGEASIPLGTILMWALQICHAMEYARGKGLVCHRDLKPQNILIGRDRVAKITDFGTVKTKDISSPGLTNLQGTLPYMPPESLDATQISDVHRDIWSFGIILYQAVARALPWSISSDDPKEWAKCIRTCPKPALITPLWPIVSTCLELDSKKRYSSFASLRREIEALHLRVTGRSFIPAKMPGETAEACLNRAFSLHQLDRIDEAITLYKHGLSLEGGSFDRGRLWHNLGRAYRDQNLHSDAESCFQKATEADPQLDRPWIDWAKSKLGQGDVEGARGLLAQARKIGSEYVDVWLALAAFHERSGDWQSALLDYEHAIKIDRTDSDSWWGKGKCLFVLNRLDEARLALREGIAIEPMRIGIGF